MSKRKRFIFTSIVLSFGFVGVQLLPESYRFISIGGLGLLTVILFTWSLWEGLGRDLTLLTLILPLFYTLGVGFFWFLLPTSLYTRIPIIILYSLGIYALCLTSNIYTVATIRTIALLRAARGVGFVLTLTTLFLIFDTILSFKWPIYLVGGGVFLVTLPLMLQGFWVIPLEKKLDIRLVKLTVIAALTLGEITLLIFFWPVSVAMGSLFLTVFSYMILGLGQAYLDGRLFSQTVREYFLIGAAVFLGMFFATHWGE